jgi:hypothetical protein
MTIEAAGEGTMPFDLQLWSETWSMLALPLAVPLAIWAWFVADVGEEERSSDAVDTEKHPQIGQIPQIFGC